MDTLTSKDVTTRKPHICFGCGQKYPAGTFMHFSTIADDGTVWNSYICGTCQEIMKDMESGDDFGFGEIRDGDIDVWEETKQKLAEGVKDNG